MFERVKRGIVLLLMLCVMVSIQGCEEIDSVEVVDEEEYVEKDCAKILSIQKYFNSDYYDKYYCFIVLYESSTYGRNQAYLDPTHPDRIVTYKDGENTLLIIKDKRNNRIEYELNINPETYESCQIIPY